MKESNVHSEQALMKRIAAGDEEAFGELYHRYAPELHPLVLKLTKSPHIVDDIVQDLFLKIWLSHSIVFE